MAEQCKDHLSENKVPLEHIISISNSRNTREDAGYSLKEANTRNLKNLLVLSSADHILRVKWIFNKLGNGQFNLTYKVSDYWSGLWSIRDFFWHVAGMLKYGLNSFFKK